MQSRAEAAFICAHVRLDFEVVSDEKQRKRKENRKEKEKKKKKKIPSLCVLPKFSIRASTYIRYTRMTSGGQARVVWRGKN